MAIRDLPAQDGALCSCAGSLVPLLGKGWVPSTSARVATIDAGLGTERRLSVR